MFLSGRIFPPFLQQISQKWKKAGKVLLFSPLLCYYFKCGFQPEGRTIMTHDSVCKVTIKAMFLDGLFWASSCSFNSFIVPYLTDNGFSEGIASILVTIISTLSFLVQPITGRLCDTRFSQKQVYLTLSACSIPLLILLAQANGNIPLTLLCLFCLTITLYQVPGLVDSLIVRLKKENPGLNYGLPRGTGSFVFAIAAQIMGMVTVRWGHGARLYMGAAAVACSMIAAFTIHLDPAGDSEKDTTKKVPVSVLLKNKSYLMVLGVTFLAMTGTSCVNTYLPMLATRLGGDSGTVGSSLALAALCEVPAMVLMNKILQKVKAKRVILTASFFYVLRLALHLVVPNVSWLIGIQALQGLSFAVLWPASIYYINDIVEDGVKSTAVMTFSSVGLGISNIFGAALGSVLLPIVGVYGIFAVCTGLTILGLLLALLGFAKKWWI